MRVWLGLAVSALLASLPASAAAQSPCPAGATAEGASPPKGFELRCIKDGALHGPWSMWFPSGRKMREATMDRGVFHGEHRVWHSNGVLASRRRYRRGVPVGEWVSWRVDKTVRERIKFKGGKRLLVRSFHRNGKLARISHYRAGLLDGVTELFDAKGVRAGFEFHIAGRPIEAPKPSKHSRCARWWRGHYVQAIGLVRGVKQVQPRIEEWLIVQCGQNYARIVTTEYCDEMHAFQWCYDEEVPRAEKEAKTRKDWRQRMYERVYKRVMKDANTP